MYKPCLEHAMNTLSRVVITSYTFLSLYSRAPVRRLPSSLFNPDSVCASGFSTWMRINLFSSFALNTWPMSRPST